MEDTKNLTAFTVEIIAAHVGRYPTAPSELPALIRSVHETLANLETGQASDIAIAPSAPAAPTATLVPAVPIAESVTPDHIVCLEDGKKLKMLKRYLSTHYGLTPDAYRTKWGLPRDYPMVAPSASKRRSAIAKKTGLGAQRSPR